MARFCVTVPDGEEEQRAIAAFCRREQIAPCDRSVVERVLGGWVRQVTVDMEAAAAADAARERAEQSLAPVRENGDA
jgi:hypothetical protein